MKHKIKDYIDHIVVSSGTCLNTGEFGQQNWKGYTFNVRDRLDDYESVEDWREDYGNTTQYCYRDFNDPPSSPDMIRAEFRLWYVDYSGSDFMNIMLKLENVIYLYEVDGKAHKKQALTQLEKIANYIYTNKCCVF